MICLSDNDIILKLAVCNLLDEAFTALGAKREEIYVLPSAKHVLLKPIKKPDEAKSRLGEAISDRLHAFLDSIQVISVAPSAAEQQIFEDIVGIDTGEAGLFSVSAHYPEFLLATSDKNSLRALSASPACQSICRRLAGKVICFEQVVLRLIDRFGFDPICDKVVPARQCDTALRAVFGSGLDASEDSVRAGLTSYITDLRNQTGGLLAG